MLALFYWATWKMPLLMGRKFAMQSDVEDSHKPLAQRPQGPPDLDEVFRDWRKRLEKMLGELSNQKGSAGGGSGGEGGSPLGNMSGGALTAYGLAGLSALVLIFWLLSGLYIVDSNERAVVMQFGRFTKINEPGLNWRLPYPFQSHQLVNFSSVRTLEIGSLNTTGSRAAQNQRVAGTQMLTGDENVLLVHYTVQYDVREADHFVLNDVSPDTTARLAAETAMREVVGSSTLDKVLYEDREVVAKNARDIMQAILDRYKVGVRVIRVNLQSVRPPEQVQSAFDDAIKASQDRQRQVNEGEAYAQEVVPRAKGTASRLIEQAQGYRESVVSRASGDASRFSQIYQQYKNAKEVTRERMYLDTMADILGRTKKIVIDPQSRSLINLSTPSHANNATPVVIEAPVGSSGNKMESINASTPIESTIDKLRRR